MHMPRLFLMVCVFFRRFDVRTTFIHDLTLDVWSHECVFSNGKGKDLNMDMHRGGGCPLQPS